MAVPTILTTWAAGWKEELVHLGLHEDVIKYFSDKSIWEKAELHYLINSREEVQTCILDKIPSCKEDLGQRRILNRLYEQASTLEKTKLEQAAKGINPEELEAPFPAGVHPAYLAKFREVCTYSLRLDEALADPLAHRLLKEIRAKSHSVLPLARVRNQEENSETAVAKKLLSLGNLQMWIDVGDAPATSKPVVHNYAMVRAIWTLFVGGYVVVGREELIDGEQFCTLEDLRNFASDMERMIVPLGKPWPNIYRCMDSYNKVAAILAKSMRDGLTLTKAIKENQGKIAAMWLWTSKTEGEMLEERMKDRMLEEPVEIMEQPGAKRKYPPPPPRAPAVLKPKPPPRSFPSRGSSVYTGSGKLVCSFYNKRGGCRDGDRCHNAHLCDRLDGSGKPCLQQHPSYEHDEAMQRAEAKKQAQRNQQAQQQWGQKRKKR